ncbi:PSD1 and planctomycete cytochrome C domain-containing protein [Tautonia marina]|uniref:PSD1 and planctomycete cytochrome C domain-containing protein n=1 Tax=Tautonia marina TaxID=2653855 RepID=UPI0012606A7F|nr:PSD1 and planctomycete cytochrome C domain-containing protein [Tautonia marina]
MNGHRDAQGRRFGSGFRRSGGIGVVGLLAALLVLLPHSAARADEPQTSPEGVAFFETHVRPVLVEHCYSCHSEGASRIRGGLVLDTKAGWEIGGDLGPSVVPGDPENSLLIEAVRYEDVLLKMPPEGKLSDQQIERLVQWVEMGAPDPRVGDGAMPSEAAKVKDWADPKEVDLWSFQPPSDPEVPSVADPSWPKSDLDHFLLSELEAQGLSPAPPADRRTLIRRATFDLTGLPPTPEEVEAFLADESPEAFDRVVDRLLASPAYGERWGRHWLDVARYADSNGSDENVAHGNAWRYRDYVVEAFNSDRPYDRFVVEQLAGDLLPEPEDPEESHNQLIATGFLSLGPKVLAEPDQQKMEMDIIDEQLDTLGRTFLGLTIGCARCHDHKFDPISAADYYALAGIFKSTRTMDSFKTVARWHEHEIPTAEDLARKAEHDQQVAEAEEAIRQLTESANAALIADGGDGFELPEKPETLYPEDTKAELKRLQEALKTLKDAPPELPSAMGVTEGETVTDLAIHIRGSHLTLGEVVPRRVPTALTSFGSPEFNDSSSGRLQLARWIVEEDHPLTARVMVNRIWRWHFGTGIVASTDNFGVLGDQPTHGPLLDWLAHRFVEDGWSIKAMHRRIMGSSTYQMSSAFNPKAAAIDPENRLLWRMPVRRLEAEAIRDALLAVGGRLDRQVGGSLLTVENRGYFFNHTSKDLTNYDTNRRSLYLPIVRNHLYDVFQLFDASDASVPVGDRQSTTVAPQALFLMNSDLVLQVASDLAADLLDHQDWDDAARIASLYERAYARPPSDEESARALAAIERLAEAWQSDGNARDEEALRRESWTALCQVILAANEFVYIR